VLHSNNKLGYIAEVLAQLVETTLIYNKLYNSFACFFLQRSCYKYFQRIKFPI